MRNYPKHIKRLLREWSAEAYERELNHELRKLDRSFSEWRAGQIGAGELSDRIHKFYTGPSRELFNRYNGGYNDMNVAYAIVVGLLEKDKIPIELLEAIKDRLEFYEAQLEQGDLVLPGE